MYFEYMPIFLSSYCSQLPVLVVILLGQSVPSHEGVRRNLSGMTQICRIRWEWEGFNWEVERGIKTVKAGKFDTCAEQIYPKTNQITVKRM